VRSEVFGVESSWYPTGERTMTTLTIALPDPSMLRLKELANEAGVDPGELLNACVVEWLA
jgi:hypothetical protein